MVIELFRSLATEKEQRRLELRSKAANSAGCALAARGASALWWTESGRQHLVCKWGIQALFFPCFASSKCFASPKKHGFFYFKRFENLQKCKSIKITVVLVTYYRLFPG